MVITLISEVMTLEVVADGQKIDMDELVLEDVELSIVDQVAEPTPYENCLSLCKLLIKNFRKDSMPVMKSMLN